MVIDWLKCTSDEFDWNVFSYHTVVIEYDCKIQFEFFKLDEVC